MSESSRSETKLAIYRDSDVRTTEYDDIVDRSVSDSVKMSNEVELAGQVCIVFDVSDLIGYFHNARLPTGIQRVQIEVIMSLIGRPSDDVRIMTACFTRESDGWMDVPLLLFNHVCHLSLRGGDVRDPEWIVGLQEVGAMLAKATPIAFPTGSYLLNLGTSWWLQNYFLHIRNAKAKYGIKYIPFVHDCIPIVTPEHCTEQLVKDFISWAIGAFHHADHFFVNSYATAHDVGRVAKCLHSEVDETIVVPLNADFSQGVRVIETTQSLAAEFKCPDLKPNGFVLTVGTIESRKNHVMAFTAWLRMIKTHGLDKVPMLVCVGNRGWLNDAVYAKLGASVLLRSKVLMLTGISDPQLVSLYSDSLFTLYPSSYEGWGLPVTESLCFGKVPVLARSSSLPEAGGDFADYFDLGSEDMLIAVLERLIFNADYRAERERNIKEHFAPRSWHDVATQMVQAIQAWDSKALPDEVACYHPVASLGVYHRLTANNDAVLFEAASSGEIFRQGQGWWWPETWGCWTKNRTATLGFFVEADIGQGFMLYVGLKGVQSERSTVTITVGSATKNVVIGASEMQCISLRLRAADVSPFKQGDNRYLVEVSIYSDKATDFRENTGGVDTRVSGVGVRGFMICEASDIEARLDFLEDIAFNNGSDAPAPRDSRKSVILA